MGAPGTAELVGGVEPGVIICDGGCVLVCGGREGADGWAGVDSVPAGGAVRDWGRAGSTGNGCRGPLGGTVPGVEVKRDVVCGNGRAGIAIVRFADPGTCPDPCAKGG